MIDIQDGERNPENSDLYGGGHPHGLPHTFQGTDVSWTNTETDAGCRTGDLVWGGEDRRQRNYFTLSSRVLSPGQKDKEDSLSSGPTFAST